MIKKLLLAFFFLLLLGGASAFCFLGFGDCDSGPVIIIDKNVTNIDQNITNNFGGDINWTQLNTVVPWDWDVNVGNKPWWVLANPDTNAQTACAAGQVLLGDGTCSSFAVSDTNAQTACNALEYLAGDGTCQLITHTVDTNVFTECGDTNNVLLGTGSCVPYTISEVYFPSAIVTTAGTDVNNNSLPAVMYYDNNSYTVQEAAGAAPVLTIDINFSGVNQLDSINMREQYLGGQGHEIIFEIWNWVNSEWETYLEITDQMGGLITTNVTIFDSNEHVSGGNVWTRFRHEQNGVSSHFFFLDWIQAVRGNTTLTNIEHDALSGRDSSSNHPWAVPTDGSRSMDDLNSLTDVNAMRFCLNGSQDCVSTWDRFLTPAQGDGNYLSIDTFIPNDTNAQTGCAANLLLAGVNGCTSTPTITGTNITGVPAASILAGTFGTGAYVFDDTITALSINEHYGDGSDGDVTYSSSASLTEDLFCDDLTLVHSGVTLTTNGYKIFVKGTLTNAGTISAKGGDGGNGTNGTEVSAGSGGTGGSAPSNGSIDGGLAGVPGGSGGTGAFSPGGGQNGSAGTGGIAEPYGIKGSANGSAGTAAGAGGSSTGGSGGSAGSAGSAGTRTLAAKASGYVRNETFLTTWRIFPDGAFPRMFNYNAGSGGSGGGGGGSANTGGTGGGGAGGGGSGANGGNIYIAARHIINNGTFTVQGGDGGDGGTGGNAGSGGDGGGGGGGGGGSGGNSGIMALIYQTFPTRGTLTVTAGNGGNKGSGGSGFGAANPGDDGQYGIAGVAGELIELN